MARGRLLVLTAGLASMACACGAARYSAGTDGRAHQAGTAATYTRLQIVTYPGPAPRGSPRRYELSCKPARGTVPDPALACRVLAGLHDPFTPVPRRTICSDIVAGVAKATVTGVLRGRRVAARLSLRGSCEIERWARVQAVVPGF
jgi:Subtilisin inhibitor-like